MRPPPSGKAGKRLTRSLSRSPELVRLWVYRAASATNATHEAFRASDGATSPRLAAKIIPPGEPLLKFFAQKTVGRSEKCCTSASQPYPAAVKAVATGSCTPSSQMPAHLHSARTHVDRHRACRRRSAEHAIACDPTVTYRHRGATPHVRFSAAALATTVHQLHFRRIVRIHIPQISALDGAAPRF